MSRKFGTPIEYLQDYSNTGSSNVVVSRAYVLNQIAIAGTSGGSSGPKVVSTSFPMGVSSSVIITTGAKGRYPIPYSGIITGWRLVAGSSATLTLDVWKANNAIPIKANSIFGTKPSLTAAELNSSSGLNIAVTAGDIFILEVEANDTATYIKLDFLIQTTY